VTPPGSLCLLRLSALGDVTHAVTLVRTLQDAWPTTRLSWIIGRFEQKLVGDIPGVDFIPFDKRGGWRAYVDLRKRLPAGGFDVLLHLQVALRANLVAAMVPARTKVGYDRTRSKELHSLFVDRRIPEAGGQHVLDAFGSFLQPLGLAQTRVRWDIPLSDEDRGFAEGVLPGAQPTLLISPCSSHALRNWNAAGYAAVADHAISRHGYRVLLCGGRSALERQTGDAIIATMRETPIDLIGKDTIKQLQALLARASVVLTPDSGPMHMANAAGTPVIGLHAATNPTRSGPYSDRRYCVDRYDAAARRFLQRPAESLPWGRKIEQPGVMDLIEVADVIDAFERYVADASLAQ
jgi:heptosyltransferase I